MSTKDPLFYYEEFYYSELLKLKILRRFNLWYGIPLSRGNKPMYCPDMDWDNLKIKLEGVKKNLNRRELRTYIDVCLQSPVKRIKKEAQKILKDYHRILNIQ
jgi:hypothetical protein